MEIAAVILSILACIAHIYAFYLYNVNQLFKEGKPPIISWALWALAATINFVSYKEMSDSWIVSLLPLSGSIMCIITFFITLFKGKFKKPKTGDYVVLVLGFLAILLWRFFDSAIIANFIMIFGGLIAFFPTYKNIVVDPSSEPPKPWFIWSLAFLLGTLVVLLYKWEGEYENLAYPVSAGMGHLFIAVLSKIKNNKN